jgi:hypothetical protein
MEASVVFAYWITQLFMRFSRKLIFAKWLITLYHNSVYSKLRYNEKTKEVQTSSFLFYIVFMLIETQIFSTNITFSTVVACCRTTHSLLTVFEWETISYTHPWNKRQIVCITQLLCFYARITCRGFKFVSASLCRAFKKPLTNANILKASFHFLHPRHKHITVEMNEQEINYWDRWKC